MDLHKSFYDPITSTTSKKRKVLIQVEPQNTDIASRPRESTEADGVSEADTEEFDHTGIEFGSVSDVGHRTRRYESKEEMVISLKAMIRATLKKITLQQSELRACDLEVKQAEVEKERAIRDVQWAKEKQEEVTRTLHLLEEDTLKSLEQVHSVFEREDLEWFNAAQTLSGRSA